MSRYIITSQRNKPAKFGIGDSLGYRELSKEQFMISAFEPGYKSPKRLIKKARRLERVLETYLELNRELLWEFGAVSVIWHDLYELNESSTTPRTSD